MTHVNSYPQGAFTFEEWLLERWPDWNQQSIDPYMRAAFEAGYVSAVRHHDAAMHRLRTEEAIEHG